MKIRSVQINHRHKCQQYKEKLEAALFLDQLHGSYRNRYKDIFDQAGLSAFTTISYLHRELTHQNEERVLFALNFLNSAPTPPIARSLADDVRTS